jgi:uncharacterized Zn finger protein/ERCC4-related helicase
MATSFGNTWWGNEWLRSLTNIDYENRIPRGERYARYGYVTELQIKDNVISAWVQGSRPTPYSVTVGVNRFTAEETSRLMDCILAHPVIVAELLNRKLSPTVNDIARQNNLKVFPSTWRDLDMHCSCPDWAVPCKHLAAVIYMVGQEIDNNPFLIFKLHGVDILEELKKRNISIDTERLSQVTAWQDALGLVPLSDVPEKPTVKEFPRFDFSKITPLGDAIQKLLPASPTFYTDGDFMTRYQENAKRMVKAANYILSGKKSVEDALNTTATPLTDKAVAAPNLTIDKKQKAVVRFGKKKTAYSLVDLMAYLTAIPTEKILDCSNTIFAFRSCCMLALHLAAMGNVVPVISKRKDESVMILWTPFMADQQTTDILSHADTFFSSDDIIIESDGRKKLTPERRAWFATSCFLTAIIHCSRKALSWRDKVYELFYQGGCFMFNGVGETNIPGSIKSWTDHLNTPQLRYLPVVMVSDESEDGSEFQMELSVVDTEAENTAETSLRKISTDKTYRLSRYSILRDVSLLSPLVPSIDEYLAREAESPIVMDNAGFTQFLIDIVPAMRLLGIHLLLPKSLQHILRPKPSVSLKSKPADGKSFLRLDQLLQFDWKVAIGDDLVSPGEFNKLLVRAEGLIRFKQQYFYVTADDLKRIEKVLASHNEMTPSRMLQAALSGEYHGAKISISQEVKELLRQWTTLQEVAVPKEINVHLRPYQKRGYEWMYQNMRLGFGSILADDMGLGKTLQVITLLQKLKDDGLLNEKRAIVVAPTGLLTNWQAELQKFAPTMTVQVYHGTSRDLNVFDADIMLTSYGVVRSDIDKLKKKKWAIVVIDEAQNIKNEATAQSKAVRSLKADTHIAMSGTPVENRLSEYWSIMDFANKGYLGTIKTFNNDFARPIQQEGNTACAERFRRITAPMMMRRLKTDKTIINDLPDKIEQDEFALLTPQQAAIYKQVIQESMKVIEGIDEDDKQQLFKRQGLILQMMLALKQVCNHPAQYLKNDDLSPVLSGKAEMLLDLVSAINDAGEKAIIFTQFKEMGDLLVKFITDAIGTEPMFLHGGCTLKQRKEMVDRFQNNRADRFFVLSLKAAGTGLNLTAATHVIHYDLWWNPAVEAQATDRAYRIGQHQNVMVHRFITRNTFEERINDMINSKRALADMTVSTGESWIGKLSNKELHEIFDSNS